MAMATTTAIIMATTTATIMATITATIGRSTLGRSMAERATEVG
jgi:hypothetical protein